MKVDEYENKKKNDTILALMEEEQEQVYDQEQDSDHELRLLPEERKRILLMTKEFSVTEELSSSSLSPSSVSLERKLFHECRRLNRKNIRWSY
mmetsp:Transcript_49363/g.55946  ORF Transcript_49363/g.55946 Transcript_49363/m.55946 type:complete len:93 (+) Transcript_49363:1-279(+)